MKLLTFLLGGCFLLALAVLPVRGEGNGSAAAQTIPTRTPTGEPAPNTDTPSAPTDTPPGGGEPTDPPPTAGNTTPPATIPVVTPTHTPAGGSAFLPTAAACGSLPTLQAKNLINIRSGPGTDYPIAGSLVFGEVRHIVGRAAHADWWAIEMPADAVGWVADPVVNVSGYTGNIPILEPPLLNGNTPTPGTPWNPTPNSFCPTTTATPSVTPTPSQTSSPDPTRTEVSKNQTATAFAAITDTPPDTPTLPPDTATPLPPGQTPTLPLVGENPTAPPVINDTPPSPNKNSWVLYAGIGLVVIGGAAYVLLSRK